MSTHLGWIAWLEVTRYAGPGGRPWLQFTPTRSGPVQYIQLPEVELLRLLGGDTELSQEKAANARQRERIKDLHKLYADALAQRAEDSNKIGRLTAENTLLQEAVKRGAEACCPLYTETLRAGLEREIARRDALIARLQGELAADKLATAVLEPASDKTTHLEPHMAADSLQLPEVCNLCGGLGRVQDALCPKGCGS